jgi:hypothetical protein
VLDSELPGERSKKPQNVYHGVAVDLQNVDAMFAEPHVIDDALAQGDTCLAMMNS